MIYGPLMEKLHQKLAGSVIHVDWTEGWEGGSEERAKAILDVLESLERGDYEVVSGEDD